MSPRSAALAAALALCACASAPRAGGWSPRLPAGPPRGARAEFDPASFDAVFREAVRTLRSRGFAILACDPELGAIATAPAEVDAPCRGTSCLAREIAVVKLGYRRARVTVTREVWDATTRGWRVPDDAVSAEGVAREERQLVTAAVRPRRGGAAGAEACGASACDLSGCLVASAQPP